MGKVDLGEEPYDPNQVNRYGATYLKRTQKARGTVYWRSFSPSGRVFEGSKATSCGFISDLMGVRRFACTVEGVRHNAKSLLMGSEAEPP